MFDINDITSLAEDLCSVYDNAQFKIEMRLGKWAIVITESVVEDCNTKHGPIKVSRVETKREITYILE